MTGFLIALTVVTGGVFAGLLREWQPRKHRLIRRRSHRCPRCTTLGGVTWVRGKDAGKWCPSCESTWSWWGPNPPWRS